MCAVMNQMTRALALQGGGLQASSPSGGLLHGHHARRSFGGEMSILHVYIPIGEALTVTNLAYECCSQRNFRRRLYGSLFQCLLLCPLAQRLGE